MRLDDQSDDGADGSAAGNAENIGIRERIAKQGLKADAGDGERSPDKNAEKNARQTDIENNELIFAGELAGLAKEDAEEIAAQAVERDGDGAHFESDHHDDEKNRGEDPAISEQATECQRAQAQASRKAKSRLGERTETDREKSRG